MCGDEADRIKIEQAWWLQPPPINLVVILTPAATSNAEGGLDDFPLGVQFAVCGNQGIAQKHYSGHNTYI
jgi:hypothetical protein